MAEEQETRKVALIVIDGWGIPSASSPKEGDAIAAADTPIMSGFADTNSKTASGYTELDASSIAVGLPKGLMGNSEVGHLNIGAGRVVWQDVVRIDVTIEKNELNNVVNIAKSLERAKSSNGRLHFVGLVSDGGVHSHIDHLIALLKLAKEKEVPQVFVHFISDGRDTDPKSGAGHARNLAKKMEQIGIGKIVTVFGRYYAMDRDKRWDRVRLAVDALLSGEGEHTSLEPAQIIEQHYAKNETDEFLKPIIFGGDEGRIKDDDTIFLFNYRSDRMREISMVLGDFDRSHMSDLNYPKNISLTTMTQYNVQFPFPVAFQPQKMDNVLAEWLSKKKVKQCHVAETEKYAHVTFFFNGGVEKQFEGEEREMIPSPRVATYDLEPKMSAMPVAKKMSERIAQGKFGLVMNNFAPPDMVGHTGVYKAAVEAVSETDKAIGVVYEQCKKSGYILFVTSDHGNAEEMLTEQGTPKTSHTLCKVPLVMANAPAGWSLNKQISGVLGDVAPTVLEAMGIDKPEEMDGKSLLVKN